MSNIIYTVATEQTTVANMPINLGTVIRRYGCGLNNQGNADLITRSGYYSIDAVAVVTNDTGASVTLTLDATQNNANIVGGTATATIPNGATVTMPITAVIRTYTGIVNDVRIVPDIAGLTINTLGVKIEGV